MLQPLRNRQFRLAEHLQLQIPYGLVGSGRTSSILEDHRYRPWQTFLDKSHRALDEPIVPQLPRPKSNLYAGFHRFVEGFYSDQAVLFARTGLGLLQK